jgi:hypothetical protein
MRTSDEATAPGVRDCHSLPARLGRDGLTRLLIDRGADPGGNIGACRLSNGEQLRCDFWRACERNGDGFWSDLVARKMVPHFKRRMRLWPPWLRLNRVLRVMLHERWSSEAWFQVRVEFKRALALRSEIPRSCIEQRSEGALVGVHGC